MAVLVAAGCAVSYAVSRRKLRRTLADRQQATDRQLSDLARTIRSLEARVAEMNRPPALPLVAAEVIDLEASASPEQQAAHFENEELPPETMAILTVVAAEFLGRKVRILSAKLLESPVEVVSAWSQQGRVF